MAGREADIRDDGEGLPPASSSRGVYLPGRYILEVKRPDDPLYLVRTVLADDFVLWVLCSATAAAAPATHVAGLFLALVSFWAVYEQGYVDNDRAAERWEAAPRLTTAFFARRTPTPRAAPWLWAAGSGALALVALRWPAAPEAGDAIAWAAVLTGVALVFRVYNRADKATRVWLYVALQVARASAFMAIAPVAPAASAGAGAHALSRWLAYHDYRRPGEGAAWPRTPVHLARLVFFLALSGVAALAGGAGQAADAAWIALLAFFGFKARHELADAVARARFEGLRPRRRDDRARRAPRS